MRNDDIRPAARAVLAAALSLALAGCGNADTTADSTPTGSSTTRATSSAPTTAATAKASGPAGAVYTELVAAGIELGPPNDTTANGCMLDCTQRIEAGKVAIYAFPTPEKAQQYAATLGDDGYVKGSIVLSWLARDASDEERKAMVAALP